MTTIKFSKIITLSIFFVSSFATAFSFLPSSTVAKTFTTYRMSNGDSAALDRTLKWEGEKSSYTQTESGLKILDLVEGDGDSPQEGDLISVHYAGWYDQFDVVGSEETGISFDDSRARSEQPLQIIFGKAPIIKGWEEGLKTMKKGGKRSFIIPPELGYGEKEVKAPGQPSIPANSYLKFEIELVEVDNSLMTKLRLAIPKPSSILDKPFF